MSPSKPPRIVAAVLGVARIAAVGVLRHGHTQTAHEDVSRDHSAALN